MDSESTVIGECIIEEYDFWIGVWVESTSHSNWWVDPFDFDDPPPPPPGGDKEWEEEDKDFDVESILLISFDGPTSSIVFILSIKILLS